MPVEPSRECNTQVHQCIGSDQSPADTCIFTLARALQISQESGDEKWLTYGEGDKYKARYNCPDDFPSKCSYSNQHQLVFTAIFVLNASVFETVVGIRWQLTVVPCSQKSGCEQICFHLLCHRVEIFERHDAAVAIAYQSIEPPEDSTAIETACRLWTDMLI